MLPPLKFPHGDPKPPFPLTSTLLAAIRRIEWFVETGLTGLDLAMCWFIRRIQPLQHHAKLMHEYTSDRRDSLRISVDNFSSDSIKLCLKDIVKVKDKKCGFAITYDMFVDGKCPKVTVYFPCMTYTPVLPSSHYHIILGFHLTA